HHRPPLFPYTTLFRSEQGYWAGMTLYPVSKCTPERAVDMVEMYGPERLLVNSAGDWGPSKPTAVPDFILAMRRRGHPESLIRQRSEEHTSELQSPCNLVCRLLLEKKKLDRPPAGCKQPTA